MEESAKQVDEKQRSFYENLFTKTAEEKKNEIEKTTAKTTGAAAVSIGEKVRQQ